MGEYIERKAVLLATDILDEYLNDCERLYFVKQIKNIPTADVVEVRHGHWIEKVVKPEWLDDDVEIYYVCSVCECNDFGKSPYCPFCGAKMDGKGEGE